MGKKKNRHECECEHVEAIKDKEQVYCGVQI